MRTAVVADASAGEERVPGRIRALVWLFLAAFVVCALAGIEAWPLTGWRLFSGLRHERTTSWRAMGVDAAGVETAFSFGSLPAGYHWGTNVLSSFAERPPAEQVRVCNAWADAARRRGTEVATIRIYRVVRVVSDRAGRHGPADAVRTLAFTCGDGTVHAEDAGA